jgi:uncharacterized protein (TIGR03083 family)
VQAPPPPEVLVRNVNALARAETAAIVGELRAGGEAAWMAPTACSEWVARDVVVHLVGAAQAMLGNARAALEGRPAPSDDPAAIEARLAPLRQLSGEALLAELERAGAEYAAYLEGLPPEQLAQPVAGAGITLQAWQWDGIYLDELVVHHWDLRVPQTPDARLTADAMPFLVPMFLQALPLLAIGEKTDGTWQLDVAGPTEGPVTIRVSGDQVTAQPGPASNSDARLGLEGEAFLRFIWGRLDLPAAIDSGYVQLQGDRDRALALQRIYPGA